MTSRSSVDRLTGAHSEPPCRHQRDALKQRPQQWRPPPVPHRQPVGLLGERPDRAGRAVTEPPAHPRPDHQPPPPTGASTKRRSSLLCTRVASSPQPGQDTASARADAHTWDHAIGVLDPLTNTPAKCGSSTATP